MAFGRQINNLKKVLCFVFMVFAVNVHAGKYIDEYNNIHKKYLKTEFGKKNPHNHQAIHTAYDSVILNPQKLTGFLEEVTTELPTLRDMESEARSSRQGRRG